MPQALHRPRPLSANSAQPASLTDIEASVRSTVPGRARPSRTVRGGGPSISRTCSVIDEAPYCSVADHWLSVFGTPRAGRSRLRRAMPQTSTVPVFSTRGVDLNVYLRRLPAGVLCITVGVAKVTAYPPGWTVSGVSGSTESSLDQSTSNRGGIGGAGGGTVGQRCAGRGDAVAGGGCFRAGGCSVRGGGSGEGRGGGAAAWFGVGQC